MNQVNWVLDEFDSIRGRFRSGKRKTELLQRATRASIRGVEALLEEQWTKDPTVPYSEDRYMAAEAVRQDAALLRAFIEAECRLLLDLGVDANAVERVRRGLHEILLQLDPREVGAIVVADRLQQLVGQLNR